MGHVGELAAPVVEVVIQPGKIVDDNEAVDAFQVLCETEGIIPALESAHAIAAAMKIAKDMSPDEHLLINLSGRGDKDVEEVQRLLR